MTDNENPEPGAEIWNSTNGPLARLARIDQKTTGMEGWLKKLDERLEGVNEKLDRFIEMHNEKCPAKVHRMLFALLGAAILVLGTGVVSLVVKALSS